MLSAAIHASACLVGRPLVRRPGSLPRALHASLLVTARGRGGGGAAKEKDVAKDKDMRGVKKENLPSKTCVVCDRPFTWRKKWERCWDEVTTCSKSCNAKRRGQGKGVLGGNGDDEFFEDDVDGRSENEHVAGDGSDDGSGSKDAKKDARKAAKKVVKAAKRAKRAGGDEEDGEDGGTVPGSKPCDLCSSSSNLLVRCRTDETKQWRMACGKCWKTASGGVPDGDAEHPHYRYGGLWKNRKAGVRQGWKAGGKSENGRGDTEKDEASAERETRFSEEDLSVLTAKLASI
jgi:hypothetical protein